MPTQPGCPPPQELHSLARGEIPDEQAASLRDHLRSCPVCARQLAAWSAADDQTLAEGADTSRWPLPAPDVTLAMADVAPPAVEFASTSESAAHFPPPTDAQADEYLAPPQAPGEIGRLGPYRVLRVLGSGEVGFVFEAEDPQ